MLIQYNVARPGDRSLSPFHLVSVALTGCGPSVVIFSLSLSFFSCGFCILCCMIGPIYLTVVELVNLTFDSGSPLFLSRKQPGVLLVLATCSQLLMNEGNEKREKKKGVF